MSEARNSIDLEIFILIESIIIYGISDFLSWLIKIRYNAHNTLEVSSFIRFSDTFPLTQFNRVQNRAENKWKNSRFE